MKKEEKLTIEDHKKYMDEKVQHYLKPLMVDILKNRPTNVLNYITEWCRTKGAQIQKNAHPEKPVHEDHFHAEKVAKEEIRKSIQEIQEKIPHELPSSEDEGGEDIIDETEEEEQKRLTARLSNNKKKLAISAEADKTDGAEFNPPVVEKSEEQSQKIREVLKMNFMFANLDENDQEILIKAMNIRNYEAGEQVIKQGDDGAELFVVGSGALECSKKGETEGESVFLKNYEIGDVFGELALMYNAPRAAEIVSKEQSVLFSLDRETFNHIVKNSAIRKRDSYEQFLSKIDILSDLDIYEKAKICDCLKKEIFKNGQEVIKEGEAGQKFYLVQSGKAEALQKQEDGSQKVVFEYGENDYFGELALINNDPRKATIKVISDKLEVVSLDSKSFKRLLGPIEEILKRNSAKYEKYIK